MGNCFVLCTFSCAPGTTFKRALHPASTTYNVDALCETPSTDDSTAPVCTMPPFLSKIIARSTELNPGIPSNEFSDQWKHPGDVFSVLLILGGDVVGRALAQFAGGFPGSPSFSFGEWHQSADLL